MVKLDVDFNFSRLPWIIFSWDDNWFAAKFNGTIGVPGAVETTVEQICKNAFKLLIKLFKVAIVLFPNNNGSVAFLEPKYNFPDCNPVFLGFPSGSCPLCLTPPC